MDNYGMSEYQIQRAFEKVNFNRDFMYKNGIHLDNKFIPYADFVKNSYMNSDRYIAELQHRAWSIFDYAKMRDLKNIFFTISLPSVWHPMKTIKYGKNKKKLVFNKKFGGRKYIKIKTLQKNKYEFINAQVIYKIPFLEPEFDYSQTVEKYTPHNASIELSKQLKRFLMDRSYTSILKLDRCYFRVTEPHKDGTPHLHVSLFVPDDKFERCVKALERLYPAPMGDVVTNVQSPVSYLMKYVLKTLDDLREENKDISSLSLWYLYHGISRFYTSRTFVSLDVYRKLNGKYTLIELTKEFNDNNLSVYLDTTSKKVVLIENEFGTLYTPKPVNFFQKQDFKDRLSEEIALNGPADKISKSEITIQIDSTFEPVYKEKNIKPIELIIDDEQLLYLDGQIKKPKKMPYQMNDYELYNYFNNLDIETVNQQHYIYTRNILIECGYDVGECLKLSSLDDVNDYFECEEVF